ncbi:MAG TPA: hypothetical protein VHL09_13395, partial [Dehalococcoidia bacterium]|nr:hypothetical protein [Dehalococcoidia bacterium]
MWRNRLWLRLWLASAFVLVVAVLTAAFVAHLSSTRAFAFYIARGNAIQQQRVQQILGRFHDARGDWSGVGVVLKTLQPPGQGPILLFDPAGRLIAGVEPGGRPITPQDWSGAAPPVSLSTPDLDDSPGLFAALDPEEVDPAVVPVTDEIGNVIARVQLPAAPVQGLLRDRGTAE